MTKDNDLEPLNEEAISGIDSIKYAYPKCEFCQGTGYVTIEDGGQFPLSQICGCVIENRRRHVAKIQIDKAFGLGKRSMTFSKYNPGNYKQNQQALQGCINYVKNWEAFRDAGIGFALQGTYGCGKTHLATATLISLVKKWSMADGQLLRPYSIATPLLFRLARERFENPKNEDVIAKAMNADILLLDDLGAERHNNSEDSANMSWVDEQLYTILDWRISNNLPTIYTTNCKASELARDFDPRVFRRLQTRTAAFWPIKEVPGTGIPDKKFTDLLNSSLSLSSTPKPSGEIL